MLSLGARILQFRNGDISFGDQDMMLLVLPITGTKMILLELGFRPLLLLNIILQLFDRLCQTFLVFLLGVSIFLDLLCSYRHLSLELFTGILTVSDHVLIIHQILFQVVKDFEFFIKSNKGI